jgi:predicted RNA-binding protein
MRPEVVHYRKLLGGRYAKPEQAKTLLLMPQTETKPFHKSREYKRIARTLRQEKQGKNEIHTCFYAFPFGVVPAELDEVYPLSQHETVLPLDKETTEYVAKQVADYVNRANYETVVLINDSKNWKKTIADACRRTCRRKKINFRIIDLEKAPLKKNLCLA